MNSQPLSLESAREEFPLVKNTRYFMTNSLGAMPRSVPGSFQEMCNIWSQKGADAWEDWAYLPGKVGDQVGRLIGAPAGSVMMHINISALLAMLLSSLDFTKDRNEIVLADMDFPTLHFLGDTWKKYGAKPVMIKARDGIGVTLEDWENAITEKTRLVLTCQVFFGSSFLQDIPSILSIAKRKGAETCVDIYQSVGAMPIDVKKWGAEYVVGGSHKYLCGGTGAAFLYVREDLQKKLKPSVTGWLSHQDPFDMRAGPMVWNEGSMKWMGGTPSVAPLYVAPCGYEIIERLGLEAIRKVSLEHTEKLLKGGRELGFEIRSPENAESRGGSMHFRFKGVETSQEKLKKRGFLVHYRPSYQGLRVSPHFYNTHSEIDSLLCALKEIRDE